MKYTPTESDPITYEARILHYQSQKGEWMTKLEIYDGGNIEDRGTNVITMQLAGLEPVLSLADRSIINHRAANGFTVDSVDEQEPIGESSCAVLCGPDGVKRNTSK